MKRLLSIFSGLLCISCSVFAQDEKKFTSPAVTKGYYSIGNNAAKLGASNGTTFQAVKDSTRRRDVDKGYYSMKNNRKKMQQQVIAVPSDPKKQTSRPAKGYYSIGNNADKLNK